MWAKVICFSWLCCCSIFLKTTVTVWFHRFYSFEMYSFIPIGKCLPHPAPFGFFLLSSGKCLKVSYSSQVLIWSMCDFLANCFAVLPCYVGSAVTVVFTVCDCGSCGIWTLSGNEERDSLGVCVAAAGPCWKEGCQLQWCRCDHWGFSSWWKGGTSCTLQS